MAMHLRRRHLLIAGTLLSATAIITTIPVALARRKDNPTGTLPTRMDEQKRAIHALNRMTFGPRPGDVARVIQIGVDKWIEIQLHPEKIEDRPLDARLAPFRTLGMNTKEIVDNFPTEQVIKQIADGKASLPRDSTLRAVYEAQLQRYENKQERKEEAVKKVNSDSQHAGTARGSSVDNDSGTGAIDPDLMRHREERRSANLRTQELLDLPPAERMTEILHM